MIQNEIITPRGTNTQLSWSGGNSKVMLLLAFNPVFFCLITLFTIADCSCALFAICLSNVRAWRGIKIIPIPTLTTYLDKYEYRAMIERLGFDNVLLASSGIWVPSRTSRRKSTLSGRLVVRIPLSRSLRAFPPNVNSKLLKRRILTSNYVSG